MCVAAAARARARQVFVVHLRLRRLLLYRRGVRVAYAAPFVCLPAALFYGADDARHAAAEN